VQKANGRLQLLAWQEAAVWAFVRNALKKKPFLIVLLNHVLKNESRSDFNDDCIL